MSILSRLLRKENPAYKSILATVTPGQARWTPRDYQHLADEGYRKCAVAFGCIKLVASTGSRISWILRRGDKELDDHPLLKRLRRPNEYESGTRFMEKVISYYLMTGNSYIVKIQGIASAPPRYLYSLRPDRMRVIPSSDWKNPIGGWQYTAGFEPQVFPAVDVLHLMEFHPTDDWYGLSRLEVAGYPIDILAESMRWNKSLLQNDVRPSLGLNLKSSLTKDQRNELDASIKAMHSGGDHAGNVLISEAEGTWTLLSHNPKELDWTAGNEQMMRQICAIFNVWSGLLGDNKSTTYSNYQEGRKALYEEATLPIMDIMRDELQYWLVPLYGDDLTLDYDRDHIEALQEDRGKKWTYVNAAKCLKINEQREALGYENIPEGEVVMVPMGEMPLGDASAPAGDLSGAAKFRPLQSKSLGGFWRGGEQRKALWSNFERRIAQKERSFGRELSAYLKAQGEAVAERADRNVHADMLLTRKEAVKDYVERFKARYTNLYTTAFAAGQYATEGKLYNFDGDRKDAPNISDDLRKRLEALIEKSAEVITDETISEIQDVMRESLGANLTASEIASALRVKLVDTMAPVRAARIARTETGMLENYGNLDGFKDTGVVTGKGWLCSFVPASRDAHMEADGQEVGIDESFTVGGEQLDYPMDRSHGASAGNIVNCLCAIYPVAD